LTYIEVCSYDRAHGDAEVNCISWCPRSNMHGVLATVGDDGILNVWKVYVSGIYLVNTHQESLMMNNGRTCRPSMIISSELILT
jgi:WD40 repeat protein